jgi:hypothetical protein
MLKVRVFGNKPSEIHIIGQYTRLSTNSAQESDLNSNATQTE